MGKLNPFRYRGYVYDEETGLYYLRSRYYNPEWGRFISADALLGKTGKLLGHNLYCYCENEPIACFDPSGHSILDIIKERLSEMMIADGASNHIHYLDTSIAGRSVKPVE